MDSSDSSGRPSSVAVQTLDPAAAPTNALIPAPLPAYRVHTATDEVIYSIPDEILATHSRHFGNKVVLGFETEFSLDQAREWIHEFNLHNTPVLTFSEELPNALFVILFEVEDPRAVRLSMLAASPLRAGDTYASVNEFTIAFDPCNRADFKHLVTVRIPRGDRDVFALSRHILSIIGKQVKADLGPDHRRIAAVVETTRKLFPAQGKFRLQDSVISTVLF